MATKKPAPKKPAKKPAAKKPAAEAPQKKTAAKAKPEPKAAAKKAAPAKKAAAPKKPVKAAAPEKKPAKPAAKKAAPEKKAAAKKPVEKPAAQKKPAKRAAKPGVEPEDRWEDTTRVERSPLGARVSDDLPLPALVPERSADEIAEEQRHRFTGAPLLPRERTSGASRRGPRGAEAAPPEDAVVPAKRPPARAPKAPAAPAAPAAPTTRHDPLWGELTARPPTAAETAGAAFWGTDGKRWERPTSGYHPEPSPRRDDSGPAAFDSGAGHAPQPRGGQPSPGGQPGEGGPQGEGGRRRRRRRRRGGGGGGGGGFGAGPDGGGGGGNGHGGGPNGHALEPLPQDPINRRLRRQFNLRAFRPGQERVIKDLLVGKDVLAVMPTGAGKSLTYQLTAFELPGVTVVVSPLLALMSDQLQKLRRTGVVGARLDSTETAKQKRETLERIDEGRHKIIYVTPERAASGKIVEELGQQKVGLFVVDEAHCVSEWGHDFRPAYLSLKTCIASLPSAYPDRRPPILALTATATPQVAEDILKQLELKEPTTVHTGFNRPSLTFDVRNANDLKQQVRRLIRLIRRIKGPGIVYCSTVRDTEALFGALPKLGIKVGIYNGKMTTKDREESQKNFMRNQPRIMVATNAFGLGVDKPDIRFVIHWNIPGSIESYYQEAGRAGRDGKPSRCILLYNPNDEAVQEFFLGGKYPTKSEMKQVIFALSTKEGTLKEVALNAGTSQAKARVVLNALRDRGLCEELPGPAYRAMGEPPDELTIGRAAEEYRKRREGDRNKLEWMIRYARSTKCRMRLFLEYFGETDLPMCGRCDNCKKYGTDADKEKTVDLMSPVEIEEMEEDIGAEQEPHFPELPTPPRKDPTTMF